MHIVALKIAIVKQIVGKVIAISPDGSTRVLRKGDEIFLGDIIKTAIDAKVRIVFDDGEVANIGFNSTFRTTNVFAEQNGELVIPGMQKDEKDAKHEDSEHESNIHHGGSNLSSQASLNNAGFSKSGHYTNIFDNVKHALREIINYEKFFNAPVSTIKGAVSYLENIFNAPVSTIKGTPAQATKPSVPFIDNVPKFFLDADTNKDGLLDKNEILASPETTKRGNKFYTPVVVTLPPAAKDGDIIKIKSGSQTLKYKIDLTSSELIQVDDNGSPVPAPTSTPTAPTFISVPLTNGKAKIPDVEIPNGKPIDIAVNLVDKNGHESGSNLKVETNDVPPASKVSATLSIDKNGDGVIDATEMGVGEDSVKTDVKFLVPDDMKSGDKIKSIVTDANGDTVTKIYTINKENNTATDEAGNVYPLKPNGKGAMEFDVPNGATITPGTEIKTQFIDRFGNEGVIKQKPNTISNKAEATLSADTNNDGVISKSELKNNESSVDIHLPNTMKPGESVKVTIDTGSGTPTPKEFILSPDKKSVYDAHDPSHTPISIQNGKFEVPGVKIPISEGTNATIKTEITKNDGSVESNENTAATDITPPTRSAKIEFSKNLPNVDGKSDNKLDTFENGYGNDSDKTEVTISIPTQSKPNEKIRVAITNPDGNTETKEFTIGENGKVIAPDGNEIDASSGKFKINVPIKNGAKTSIDTTVIDQFGNEGATDSQFIVFDDKPKAKFIKDIDGDGLIDGTNGVTITGSDVLASIPSTAKVGDELKVSVLNPNTNKQEIKTYIIKEAKPGETLTTYEKKPDPDIEYEAKTKTLTDEYIKVVNKDDPTDVQLVNGSRFLLKDVPVNTSKPTLVDIDLVRDGTKIFTGSSSGRLFKFGILDYVDDVKLVTSVDGGASNPAKYLLEKDFEHIISTSKFDDTFNERINYKIALTNDESPMIKFGIAQKDTDIATGGDGGKVLIEVKDEAGVVKSSFYANIKDNVVVADFEAAGVKLDRAHHIIDATYVDKNGVEKRSENLTIAVDLDATPDGLKEPSFGGSKSGSGQSYKVTFGGEADTPNRAEDKTSIKVDVVDVNNSSKQILPLTDLKYEGEFLTTLTSGSKNFIVKRLDDAGNMSVQTVSMISNSGLDVDMWFYDCANKDFNNYCRSKGWIRGGDVPTYNGGWGLHVKNHYSEWADWTNVSATTTFNEVTFRSGKDWQLAETKPRPGELNMKDMARVGHSPNASDTDHNGIRYNVNHTGNYMLLEAEPVGTDLIMRMQGWIYINETGTYTIKASQYESAFSIDIADHGFKNNTWAGDRNKSQNFTLEKGFHKINIQYVDDNENVNLDVAIKKAGESDANYKIIGSAGSGTHLFSDNYVKALEQNGFIDHEVNKFHKILQRDGKYYGDDTNDFNNIVQLKHDATETVGSNLNDAFVYNGKPMDGKGGIDTLIFVDDVDLSKVANLDKNLESFERIQLGTSDQAVSIGLDAKSVLDIIDSRVTKITGKAGTENINTVLKIFGDSDDIVALKGKGTIFTQATNEEVTMLNSKHSVIGDEYNKVAVDASGHAVNQVYKGTYGSGASAQTFFIEIDKDVSVVDLH